MPKEAVFTMKLEPELRTAFMAAAAAADRPASQILREMMRSYIQQQRESREYEAFLRAKVTAARRSVESGQGHPDADVEAEFSARRERAFRPE
jgi:predicted transcriptional regulator